MKLSSRIQSWLRILLVFLAISVLSFGNVMAAEYPENTYLIYVNSNQIEMVNPFNTAQNSEFEHHSCSFWRCMFYCLTDKEWELVDYIKTGTDIVDFLAGAISDCLCGEGVNWCEARELLENTLSELKNGLCQAQCTQAATQQRIEALGAYAVKVGNDLERYDAIGDCARCLLVKVGGLLGPEAKCAVGLADAIANALKPYADCASECALPPSAWSSNWGHPCHIEGDTKYSCDSQGGVDLLVCHDCEWEHDSDWRSPEDCGECRMTASGPQCDEDEDDGDGGDDRPRRPPTGPGSDRPDERQDVAINLFKNQAENTKSTGIAVLENGYPWCTMWSLNNVGKSATLVSIDYIENIRPEEYPVLIIPSGGLYGLDSLQSFKDALKRYVSNGGNLIVFAQQHGYEYQALPGGNLTGYGWLEDQSCIYGSVKITNYHPIFSGLTGMLLNVNVDGFFTSYPENSTVLLTRTKNGMPVMILYEYGRGHVIATTIFSDVSSYLMLDHGPEEYPLLRDLISWAEYGSIGNYKPGEVNVSMNILSPYPGALEYPVPEFEKGETVNLQINVTNYGNKTANKVSFLLLDPSYDKHWYNLSLPEEIQSNESRFIDLNYQTDESSKSGIWTVYYVLYANDEFVCFNYGGEFALDYNITELSGYTATITVRDPDGNTVKQESREITILPGRTAYLNFTINSNKLGVWSVEYSVFSENGVLMSDVAGFALSEFREIPNGYSYHDSEIDFSITSNAESYAYGSEALFTFHLWNHGNEDKQLFVRWWVGLKEGYFPVYVPAGEYISKNIALNISKDVIAYGSIIQSVGRTFIYGFLCEDINCGGYDWHDWHDWPYLTGIATKGFWFFYPSIKTYVETDKQEYRREENVSIFLNFSNMERVSHNATAILRVNSLDNKNIFSDTFDVKLGINESKNETINFTLNSNTNSGLYIVTIEVYENGLVIGSNSTYFEVLDEYSIRIGFDNPSKKYSAGQNMATYINITKFFEPALNTTLNISIPSFNYTNYTTIKVSPNDTESIILKLTVPENITPGIHYVNVKSSHDNLTTKEWFIIPESELQHILGGNYSAGENISIKLKNIGSVNTSYIYYAILKDSRQNLIFQDYRSGVIMGGEILTFNRTIPEGVVNGTYYLTIKYKNLRTNRVVNSVETIPIDGLGCQFESRTDKKVYLKGENVKILTNITQPEGNFSDVVLNLKVSSKELMEEGPGEEECVFLDGEMYVNSSISICPWVYNISDPQIDNDGVLIIDADDIVIEGNGAMLIGSGSGKGIYNPGFKNVTIRNIQITDYSEGIYLYNSINNTITGCNSSIYLYNSINNTITGCNSSYNSYGIYMFNSSNNLLNNNTFLSNNEGIHLESSSTGNKILNNNVSDNGVIGWKIGIYITNSDNNTIQNNTVVRNDIRIENSDNNAIINNTISFGGIIYWNSINGTIDYCNINVENIPNTYGMYLYKSEKIRISNCTILNSTRGVALYDCDNNTLFNNTVVSCSDTGIYFYGSHYNTISDNNITGCDYGIYFTNSNNNELRNNTARSNDYGIYLSSSDYNILVNVTSISNQYGIYLSFDSDYNNISNSVFCSNSQYDINNQGSDNTGYNNTCNTTTPNWNDNGTSGCTYKCSDISKLSFPLTIPVFDAIANAVNMLEINIVRIITLVQESLNLISKIIAPLWVAVAEKGSNNIFTLSNSSNNSSILWETNIGITELNTSTIVSNLNTTGKFYLYSTLYSSTGQIIAYNVSTFYITDENISLIIETDKTIYKPNETIKISGKVMNLGEDAEECNLSIKKDGIEIYSENFTLDAKDTHTFTTHTTSNSSFTLEGVVNNVTVTDFIDVEEPEINLSITAPEIAGINPFDVSILIENTGNVSVNLEVRLNVTNKTWNITVPSGSLRVLTEKMSIKKNTTLNVTVSGDVNKSVQREVVFGEDVRINLTPDDLYLKGDVEVPFILENKGLLDSEFNATFTAGNQTITKNFFVPAGENITGNVTFNLTGGRYLLNYSSPFENVSVTVDVLSAEPAKFEVVAIYPENKTFTIGQNVSFVFEVENTGGIEDEAILTLSMPDTEYANRTWIRPFERENITINVTIPDDLEEKTYKAEYELNGEEGEFTYFVEGAKITVNASLDKKLYSEGESANLSLNTTNECNFSLSLFARVKFNDYDNTTYFTLNKSESKILTFNNIPVSFDGDSKILYSIYMQTGRSLYISSIHIYEKPDAPITLYTDRDSYTIGENVTVYINTTTEGILNLTAPGFTYLNIVNGSKTLEFTIPELMSGTYYINYSFNGFSALYPIDVMGYSVRTIKANLDDYEYISGDEMNLYVVIESNRDVSGTFRIWIFNPENDIIDEFEMNKTLVKGENEIEINRTLFTTKNGIHAIVYAFYANLSGHSPVMLTSGSEYFDGYSNDTEAPLIGNVRTSDITSNSAVIKWNTDELADSLVKYGTEQGNYTEQIYDSSYTTSHSLKLSSLKSGTKYYFVVNSSDITGNSNESGEYSFTTVTTASLQTTKRGGGGGGAVIVIQTTSPKTIETTPPAKTSKSNVTPTRTYRPAFYKPETMKTTIEEAPEKAVTTIPTKQKQWKISGFEITLAVGGFLAVAYILRKGKK